MNGEERKQSQQPQPEKSKMKPSGWKTFFSKKWIFPAIYMGAAALILALIMWYQNPQDYSIPKDELNPDVTSAEDGAPLAYEDQEAVPVNQQAEQMKWPFADDVQADVIMNFYDEEASNDVKAAALVKYEDSYWPHQGVDFAIQDDKPFEVKTVLSGKVVRAEKDPLMGFIVEIEHANHLTTLYQSLSDSRVSTGDEVKQGDTIGMAGRNLFEKDAGVHLHFEVRQDGVPVLPDKYLQSKSLDKEQE